MAFKKTKGEKGEANRYVSRKKACRMLQLDLNYFRHLCIMKGVYPREPKSRKKAQKGSTNIKLLYLKRDIIYLSHEPIIWKMREDKIYRRKVKTLKEKKQYNESKFKRNLQKPVFKMDHIVLERYPTFDKALEDLDDALSAMFLFAALPNRNNIDAKMVQLCRKLTTEFLIYVIESQSLTKTFISIRAYFYRAHIMGHKITWMAPHPFPIIDAEHAQMKTMRTFVEFYCTLLGFVNYKLFTSLNLYYPPKLTEKPVDRSLFTSKREEVENVIESLNIKLHRNDMDDDAQPEEEYDKSLIINYNKKLKLVEQEKEQISKQKRVFKDVKFFLGRETNRESLTFVIRSGGGLVSWDKSVGPGYTYPEDEKTIQYQIVDREDIEKKHLERYYIQPQWVYDSFNEGMLLPVQNYFVGTELPAHLSPFEEAHHKLYNPPELLRVKALQNKIDLVGDKTIHQLKNDINLSDDELNEEEDEPEEQPEEEQKIENIENEVENEEGIEEDEKDENKEDMEIDNKDDEEEKEEEETAEEEEVEEEKTEVVDPLAKMNVKRGLPLRVNLEREKRAKELEDFKLAASLIHRKQKRFFKKIYKKEGKVKRYSQDLRRRRIVYEREMQKRRAVALKEKASNSFE